jgi:hypothetical protein
LEVINGSKCFNDLRCDFVVDSGGRPWLVNACSQDYLDFQAIDNTSGSPHKIQILKQMQSQVKIAQIAAVSECERKKLCGFCHIEYAKSAVQTIVTAKVLVDTCR